MTLDQFVLQAQEIIYMALLAFLSVAVPTASKFGLDWLRSKIKNEQVNHELARLNEVISTVVAEIEQTGKVEFEKAKADGKVTQEELAEIASSLKEKATSKVKAIVGEESPKLLSAALSGFKVEDYISAKIEEQVLKLKK